MFSFLKSRRVLLRWQILIWLLAGDELISQVLGGSVKASFSGDEDETFSYTQLAKEAMAQASSKDFDAAATLESIRSSAAVQEKIRKMMEDPSAIAELKELMKDPQFKSQVEAFVGNPQVAQELRNQGPSAILGHDPAPPKTASAADSRKIAQERAEAQLEYEKYAAQFSGEENAQYGIRNLMAAAKDSTVLANAISDLQDPEMMRQAQAMMKDPAFQAEMKKIMQQPEMQSIMDASKNLMSQVANDPAKLQQVTDRIAKLSSGLAGSEL
mmetsp:Transcript_15564/g.18982  ORF Transcript_15564/g.18982 Transcript_15564/m.18982 type:complete len:270 (+) Transcript_15564:58-867(+)